MSYSTLDNATIVDLIDGSRYTFQFLPESITDSKGANFGDYAILGRSAPLKGYQYGQSRTLEFTVRMFADPTADGPPKSTGQIKFEQDWLLSLPYPDYNGGIKPPHLCLVSIGDSLVMQGGCTHASANYKSGTPWELGPGLTHGVEISLRFEECNDLPLGLANRRVGAG